ncbi:MAG TPA: AMP-binding protein, partial [Candidatus Dormibacteraeota bacterium]
MNGPPPEPPVLLPDLPAAAAARWPDRVAVSAGGDRLTHAALAEASGRAAVWLRERGVRRGDRVVVVGPSSVLVPALLYGIARLGAAFCLLHEQTRGRPLAHVLTDAEPALLVAAEEPSIALAGEHGVPAADLAEAARRVLRGGGPAPAVPAPGTLAVDPACLIYTSGTTAAPKAVVSTHAQMVFAALAIQRVLAYRAGDVVYCPLPLSFDYGLYQLFLGAASGAHVRLGGGALDAGPGLLRSLVEAGATILASVPSVAENLARLVRRSPGRVPPLRLLTNTGAAMPPQPLAELRAA